MVHRGISCPAREPVGPRPSVRARPPTREDRAQGRSIVAGYPGVVIEGGGVGGGRTGPSEFESGKFGLFSGLIIDLGTFILSKSFL